MATFDSINRLQSQIQQNIQIAKEAEKILDLSSQTVQHIITNLNQLKEQLRDVKNALVNFQSQVPTPTPRKSIPLPASVNSKSINESKVVQKLTTAQEIDKLQQKFAEEGLPIKKVNGVIETLKLKVGGQNKNTVFIWPSPLEKGIIAITFPNRNQSVYYDRAQAAEQALQKYADTIIEEKPQTPTPAPRKSIPLPTSVNSKSINESKVVQKLTTAQEIDKLQQKFAEEGLPIKKVNGVIETLKLKVGGQNKNTVFIWPSPLEKGIIAITFPNRNQSVYYDRAQEAEQALQKYADEYADTIIEEKPQTPTPTPRKSIPLPASVNSKSINESKVVQKLTTAQEIDKLQQKFAEEGLPIKKVNGVIETLKLKVGGQNKNTVFIWPSPLEKGIIAITFPNRNQSVYYDRAQAAEQALQKYADEYAGTIIEEKPQTPTPAPKKSVRFSDQVEVSSENGEVSHGGLLEGKDTRKSIQRRKSSPSQANNAENTVQPPIQKVPSINNTANADSPSTKEIEALIANLAVQKQEIGDPRLSYYMQKGVQSRFSDIPAAKHSIIEARNGQLLHANRINIGDKNVAIASQYPQSGEMEAYFDALLENRTPVLTVLASEEEINTKENGFFDYLNAKGTQVYRNMLVRSMPKQTQQIGNLTFNEYVLNVQKLDADGKVIESIDVPVVHLTNWSDYRAANNTELTTFIEYIESIKNKKIEFYRNNNSRAIGDNNKLLPWIHCRAGVGRTGQLITSMALINQPTLNLEKIITDLRYSRNTLMVQTEEQLQATIDLAISLGRNVVENLRQPVLSRTPVFAPKDTTPILRIQLPKVLNQHGWMCESTALANLDYYYSELYNVPNMPLFKNHNGYYENQMNQYAELNNGGYSLRKYNYANGREEIIKSIRQLTKKYGSVQGEILQDQDWKAITKDMGYLTDIVEPTNEQDFIQHVTNQLSQGHPLLVDFPVGWNGLPSNKQENGHAVLIVGIDQARGTIDVAHWGGIDQVYDTKLNRYVQLERTIPISDFYKSMQILGKTVPQRFYQKAANPFKTGKYMKYNNHLKQNDGVGEILTSIVPKDGSGYKNRLFVITPDFSNKRWSQAIKVLPH